MKKHKFSIIYSIILLGFTGYMVLNTFVISSAYQTNAGEMNASMFGNDTVESLSAKSADTAGTGNENGNPDNAVIASDDESATDEDSEDSEKKRPSRTSAGTQKHGGKHKSDSDSDESDTSDSDSTADTESSAPVTANINGLIDSYNSDDANITVTQYTYNGTTVYVADVTLSSAQYLKTAFADGTYGKNVTEATSTMAEDNNAVLAINGDNYGSQESGYVIRNGIVYRDEAGDEDVLCIYADGSMKIVDPDEYTAQELVDDDVWQALSFGPALIEDSQIAVSKDDEVGSAKASNPRTAIGVVDDLHYLFVVSDGRTDESEGLSLYELAEFMKGLGAETAYNLDGGGSSTMIFNGNLINNPTTTGSNIKERKVNDIVYIG